MLDSFAVTEAESPAQDELLVRCLAGQSEAWDHFVRRHHPDIEGAIRFTFLRVLGAVPEADVENAVQDVFARLYEDDARRLRSFEGRCPLRLWLRSVAVRHALNMLRGERLKGRPLDDRPIAAPEPEPSDRPAALDRLREELDRLPPLPRAALKMFYLDGLSYRHISAALGIPIQTLGSVLTRARERLRQSLRIDDDDA